jgi:hypothetical protein
MTESTPPEKLRQLNRDLMEKILNRAASDPQWKQRLLDDPEAAVLEAAFPETEKLREAHASAHADAAEGEVAGHQSNCVYKCYTLSTAPMRTDVVVPYG